MELINEFKNSILPGNYFLTKSMELTKINTVGTLWYTKKFLVLYYYVFLSNDLFTSRYKDSVRTIFDNYIESLDDTVKDDARKFFYSENASTDVRSEDFNLFVNFAGCTVFDSLEEKEKYINNAKKMYFSLLMGSGGQTGVKRMLKEEIQKPGFVYSKNNIDTCIIESATKSCIENINNFGEIRDNSIKHIISEKAQAFLVEKAKTCQISEKDVQIAKELYPLERMNTIIIENDMPAFIRNERQVLYYFGFFHSKSSGANDFEFSSLTPVGEMALYANYHEFLVIWEQQKIKMISQPPTADINNISGIQCKSENFAVSFTPYFDILSCIYRRKSLSLEEYKYIISRKNHIFGDERWNEEESSIFDEIDNIKKIVCAFNRNGDIKDEDFTKEIKKYLLGIRSDLQHDQSTNTFNILKLERNEISITDNNAFAVIYELYKNLNTYKLQKFSDLFCECENDLKDRYVNTNKGINSNINGKVKINWDLYLIKPDKFILLGIILADCLISNNIKSVDEIIKSNIELFCNQAFEKFNVLLKRVGISSMSSLKKEMLRTIKAIQYSDYSVYILDNNDDKKEVLAKYRAVASTDLLAKLKELSKRADVSWDNERMRNVNLVSLLKSYYLSCFAENNILKCECCGTESFITNAGEPYVEFHHLIPFNIAYGPDHYLNLFALCPTCHRKIHFIKLEYKQNIYSDLDKNNYLKIQFATRLKELKNENLLKSYHLEFLLADNAITEAEYNTIIA